MVIMQCKCGNKVVPYDMYMRCESCKTLYKLILVEQEEDDFPTSL